ncbi:MAG: hypothetical protein ACRCU0_03595 [Candidatus Rhabdochlamydia sp.]
MELTDKIYDTFNRLHKTLIPRMIVTSETTTLALENLNRIIEVAGENIASASAFVVKAAKIGAGFTAVKFCTDIGLTCYQTAILKKLSDNTIKTEDEVVNVLKNTSGDLKSSAGQFTEDVHKMGQNFGHMSAEISGSVNKASQNFGHMTESISQSSTEISGAAKKASQNFGHMAESVSQSSVEIASSANQASRNFGYMTHVTSDFLAYFSQDIHQTSRSFRVTCFSLTTFALVATMNSLASLQNSSCDQDKESMLCTAPLKSMAAAAITTGFLAIRMLMPNRVQHQMHQNAEILASNETTSVMDLPDQVLKEEMDLSFLIPEEGIDQNIEWTQEQLDSIKATNFAVFNFIEAKRKFRGKWTKQELEWLLRQDKNIFFNVVVSRVQASSIQVQLKEGKELNFLIPKEGIDQNIEWTQEQLDSIKATNFTVFNFIESKRKFRGKWTKQELEWLLRQDKNIFFNVLVISVQATSNDLDKDN